MNYGVALRNGLALGLGNVVALAANNLFRSATLNLNFVNGDPLDSRITFTRSSNAWYFNSAGVLTQATTNTPRFDYNPVTLAPRGLLIEEQRTNLLTYSEQFDNAAWAKLNSSITANTIIAPDGTLSGDKLIEDTSVSNHEVVLAFTPSASTAYTFSCYMKAAELTSCGLRFTASFGAAVGVTFTLSGNGSTATLQGSPTTATISSVGNGWYRCSFTATSGASPSATNACITTRLNAAGTANSGVFIWGAQVEAGSFATSYIPTTNAAATRAADVAVMTGTNFSSWYNQNAGTFFVEAVTSAGAGTGSKTMLDVSDGTSANTLRLFFRNSGSIAAQAITSSVSQADLNFGSYTAAALSKDSFAFALNNFSACDDGGTVATDTSGTVPTTNQMRIGSLADGTVVLNGWFRRIASYQRLLSESEQKAITA